MKTALILLASLIAAPAKAACALALALAMDVSSSVNSAEYALQKYGLVEALQDVDVREAILTQDGQVWISVYEWSGYEQQHLVADWTLLNSDEAILGLSERVAAHQRLYFKEATAIGSAIKFGADMLNRMRQCERLIIDVSGDGVNNKGEGQLYYRENGVLDGITVNGLVIKGSFPDPVIFYRNRVIGGPNAFMLVAEGGFDDYPKMIRKKLLREIEPIMQIGLR